MQKITLRAPAKINLYLKVIAKRDDGFHDIETIFEKIDLCDQITLTRRSRGIRVSCQDKHVPQDKSNIAYQAAERLLALVKRADGVDIKIVKKIPVTCGLGGGSSDAASVLLGLNKLLSLGLSRRRLLGVAAQLGADVPFFILPHLRALGRGKGEILTPLRIKRKHWYILVVPPFTLSTPRMYQALRITLTKHTYSVKLLLQSLKEGNLTSLNKYSYNSFESVIRKKYKQISQIKKALKSLGVQAALISGSGPCVFGIARNRKEAMDISKKMQARGRPWQIMVAKTCSGNSRK